MGIGRKVARPPVKDEESEEATRAKEKATKDLPEPSGRRKEGEKTPLEQISLRECKLNRPDKRLAERWGCPTIPS